MRRLGFRDFPERSEERKRELLQSAPRQAAFDHIDTNTMPRSKREIKKSVVLEVIEQHLIPDGILRGHKLVYIGSGADVEYPLALGGRNIVMVDPIFSDPRAVQDTVSQVRRIVAEVVMEDTKKLSFDFDFGSGPEPVVVELDERSYGDGGGYDMPSEAGAIILFASQSPSGRVDVDDNMRSKLADGGSIISDTTVLTKKGDAIEEFELGQ